MFLRDMSDFLATRLVWRCAQTCMRTHVYVCSPSPSLEVLAMYHPRGYGGYLVDDAVFLPGGQEAFVTCDPPAAHN